MKGISPFVLSLLPTVCFIQPPHRGQQLSPGPTAQKGKGEVLSGCVLLDDFCPRGPRPSWQKEKKTKKKNKEMCPAHASPSSTQHPLNPIKPTGVLGVVFEVFSVVG